MPSNLALAAYLAVSWTWCIGMFLPVLLTRDFDTPGWILFAIPNVIGAAAMGWVLTSPQQSVDFVRENALACRVFSLVTIGYQLFFAAWFLPRLIGPVAFAVVGLMVLAIVWPRWRGVTLSRVTLISIAVLIFSLLGFGYMLPVEWGRLPSGTQQPLLDVAGLGLSCLLGFALCPYLDLTFHEARQNATRPKLAFGVGFGVFFLAMIVFTLWYAPSLPTDGTARFTTMAWVLATHLSLQLAATVFMHARVLSKLDDDRPAGTWVVARTATAVFALVLASTALGTRGAWFDLQPGEVIYRGILGFYGLLFPAYVWLLAGKPFSTARLTIFTAAVLIALPMFAIGFFMREEAWLIGGVGVVALGKIATMLLPRGMGVPPME